MTTMTASQLRPGHTVDHPLLGLVDVVRVSEPGIGGMIEIQFGDGACIGLDPDATFEVVA